MIQVKISPYKCTDSGYWFADIWLVSSETCGMRFQNSIGYFSNREEAHAAGVAVSKKILRGLAENLFYAEPGEDIKSQDAPKTRNSFDRVLDEVLEKIRIEMVGARERFPSNTALIIALMEELGEAVEGDYREPVNKEWLQVAGLAIRLFLEGTDKEGLYFVQHLISLGGQARRLLEAMEHKQPRPVQGNGGKP